MGESDERKGDKLVTIVTFAAHIFEAATKGALAPNLKPVEQI